MLISGLETNLPCGIFVPDSIPNKSIIQDSFTLMIRDFETANIKKTKNSNFFLIYYFSILFWIHSTTQKIFFLTFVCSLFSNLRFQPFRIFPVPKFHPHPDLKVFAGLFLLFHSISKRTVTHFEDPFHLEVR